MKIHQQTANASESWKTKPTDRFVLFWIKSTLSAPITQLLRRFSWIRPSQITSLAAITGVTAGVLLGSGNLWQGTALIALSQVLDGVDGQLARLTNRQGKAGAFFDSVIDRYADGALIAGLSVYAIREFPSLVNPWLMLLAAGALIGSNSISYSTARGESLDFAFTPTLMSKGTRWTAIALFSLVSEFWPPASVVLLLFLAFATGAVVLKRIVVVLSTEVK